MFGFRERATIALVGGSVIGVGLLELYEANIDKIPYAQRYMWNFRRYPIKLVDKKALGAETFLLRFALPNSWDYTGHQLTSSVKLFPYDLTVYRTEGRYYTPINHPEQRGIIEFVVKCYDPAFMGSFFRDMKVGGTMFMGRWMSEWKYKPQDIDHIYFMAAGNGITPALQLANAILPDPITRRS
jgi:ferredoxin-NADP reductase